MRRRLAWKTPGSLPDQVLMAMGSVLTSAIAATSASTDLGALASSCSVSS